MIPAGTEVTVTLPDLKIQGIVVGKANNGITESYIVRCVDGQVPNDAYSYDTFIAQLIYISVNTET